MSLVLDASAVLELLLVTDRGRTVALRIADPALALHAPHLLDVEVAQVLRRMAASGAVAPARAGQAVADLADLDVARYSHAELLPRVWALRDTLTAYDAAYVVLAEALDAPLLTCDARMARSHGHRARVELVPT